MHKIKQLHERKMDARKTVKDRRKRGRKGARDSGREVGRTGLGGKGGALILMTGKFNCDVPNISRS